MRIWLSMNPAVFERARAAPLRTKPSLNINFSSNINEQNSHKLGRLSLAGNFKIDAI